MAQRRMMSLKIIDSDAFLDLPLTAQTLYMHLLMRADDDGFLGSVKRTIRMLGCKESDFKALTDKRFILTFDSGVCVIKHWLIHNNIRKDRYNKTTYIRELERLQVKENNSYTELNKELKPNVIPDVIPDGDTGKVRLGKVRLGKDSIEPVKIKYHDYVMLEEGQYENLVKTYGKKLVDDNMFELDNYITNDARGKKYKDHNKVLHTWIKRKIEKQNNQGGNYGQNNTNGNDFKDSEKFKNAFITS